MVVVRRLTRLDGPVVVGKVPRPAASVEHPQPAYVPDLKDGIHLMTAFRQIPNATIRKSFIAFVESLASELNDGRS